MAKKVLLITVLAFAGFFFIDEFFFRTLREVFFEIIGQRGVSHIITYTLVGLPISAGILLLHKKEGFFGSLGLNRSLLTGLIFALVCTLPMLLVYPFFYELSAELTLNKILIVGIAAGFFEELYFRGFLFGQLYRYTGLGFLLSAFLGALLYAAFHLFTGADVVEFALVFLITFVSGLIFGWVYVEWDYNLWVPVFLHMFINLSWEMFDIEENSYANWIRLATVVVFIVLTVVYKKQKGLSMKITGRKLFRKRRGGLSAAGVG